MKTKITAITLTKKMMQRSTIRPMLAVTSGCTESGPLSGEMPPAEKCATHTADVVIIPAVAFPRAEAGLIRCIRKYGQHGLIVLALHHFLVKVMAVIFCLHVGSLSLPRFGLIS